MFEDERLDTGCHDHFAGAIVPSRPGTALATDIFVAQDATDAGAGRPMWSLQGILRYKWTAALVFLAIAVPAITAVWLLVTPLYRARATVEIAPSNPRVLYKTEDNGLIPMYQQYLNSQVGIISGNKVLQRVVEREDLKETGWYRNPPWRLFGAGDSPLERLRGDLKVSPRGRTFLIDIDFVTASREDARVIVDAVLEEYKQEAQDRVQDTDLAVLNALEQTLEELRITVAGRERIAAELRQDLGTNSPEELVAQKRLRIDELEAKVDEVVRTLELARWKREQIESIRARRDEHDDGTAGGLTKAAGEDDNGRSQYEIDPEWRRLYLALQDARLKLQQEGTRLGEGHLTIVKLREQIQHAEQLLREREVQLDYLAQTIPPAAAIEGESGIPAERALDSTMEALMQEKDLLERAFAAQLDRFNVEFDKARQLVGENEELHKQKSKAELVQRRLDEKETERGPVALIRDVSRPSTPSKPHRDRRYILTLFTLFASLGAGAGASLLRASFNQTIHQAEQLPLSVRAPFLGLLPLAKAKPGAEHDGCPIEEEHYRMLRTALLNRLDGENGRVALITSGSSGVGKTTVAVMLAKSLALCGKRVLLVDADVRAPAVATRLGIVSGPGLSDILTGQADDSDVIVRTDAPGLSILPASQARRREDAELLANGVFAACLKRWRECYDVILLDSPPVLPVADARILSRHADGTILVVREGHCRHSEVLETLACLGVSGGRLLGTVYLGARSRSGRYGYAYGYGSDAYRPTNSDRSDT